MTRPIIPFKPGELEGLVMKEWPGVAKNCGLVGMPFALVDADGRVLPRIDVDEERMARALRGLLDALEDSHLVEVDRDCGRALGWAATSMPADPGSARSWVRVRIASLDLHHPAREAWWRARFDERQARITPERNAKLEGARAAARTHAASWLEDCERRVNEQRRRTGR